MLIHWAALKGNVQLVDLLTNNLSVPIDPVDDTLATPLILSILGNHAEIAESLIKRGANINHQNAQGHSPLQYACSKENLIIIKLLIERGARLNIRDKINDTPLHRLAQKGNVEILKYLLTTDIDINAQNGYGNTALHIACEDDNGAFAMLLIDAKSAIDLENRDEKTALDLSKPALRRQIKEKLNIID